MPRCPERLSSDPDDLRCRRSADDGDVAGIAGEYDDIAGRHGLNRCADVGVGGPEAAATLDTRSQVRCLCVEDVIAETEAVDGGCAWRTAVPTGFDTHGGRHDGVRDGSASAPGHCAGEVSDDSAVLRVGRVGERLDGFVVEDDGSHADTASCASAHSSTSSASASGCRSTTADAAAASRSGRSASGEPSWTARACAISARLG